VLSRGGAENEMFAGGWLRYACLLGDTWFGDAVVLGACRRRHELYINLFLQPCLAIILNRYPKSKFLVLESEEISHILYQIYLPIPTMCKEVTDFFVRCNDLSHHGPSNRYTGSLKRHMSGYDCRCDRVVSRRSQYKSQRCGSCLGRQEQRQRERER
jgi:hypothetical protein